jgi:HPr kinase/phosphorylase
LILPPPPGPNFLRHKGMVKRDTVSVQHFIELHGKQLGLHLLAGERGLQRIIREPTVNRPGLALAGFTRYFAGKRIQVIGSSEVFFLKSLSPQERHARYAQLFKHRIPCIVFCRNYKPDEQLLAIADQRDVPVFECGSVTMKFINKATLLLEEMFAPHTLEMGSMVDILGIGVIIRGESGIGKSECVLALIERGYSLVSDDITSVSLSGGVEVIGTSPEVTKDHMEVRGIGIINVPSMFGVRSIRSNKRVDLVITLKGWDLVPDVDRVGIEEATTKILGVDLPFMTIPVSPGRDLARLVEVAAFHTKLRMMGYNPAEDFNARLIERMAPKPPKPTSP